MYYEQFWWMALGGIGLTIGFILVFCWCMNKLEEKWFV